MTRRWIIKAVLQDILALSDGTLCTLSGLVRYEDIERLRSQFFVEIKKAVSQGKRFKKWQEAWEYFQEAGESSSDRGQDQLCSTPEINTEGQLNRNV